MRDNAISYIDLSGDQARQTVDVEKVFQAYQAGHDRGFSGSMAWKTVHGHRYLYRKRKGVWFSLGPRNPETATAIWST